MTAKAKLRPCERQDCPPISYQPGGDGDRVTQCRACGGWVQIHQRTRLNRDQPLLAAYLAVPEALDLLIEELDR